MESRINFLEHGKNALKTIYPIGAYLAKSPLGKSLLDLVYFRVSQINGCSFCLDMHSKD
jgi:alkylhydroperoxidase family enzyme